MEKKFDIEQTKKHLQEKEQLEKDELEKTRKIMLGTVITSIQELFNQTDAEVYIVGSLIKPYKYRKRAASTPQRCPRLDRHTGGARYW